MPELHPHRFRVFTLAEANRLVATVSDLTRHTQDRLEALRREFRDGQAEEVEPEIRRALDEWARSILDLGAQPKGIFTVDFRSPDPNVLWCWAPDEGKISHRHFTWESFKDRVSLDEGAALWPSHN